MISIDRLTFRYPGSPRYALRDVHLEIAPGEFVVVTGSSGCGKSTLALAIGGYLFSRYDGEISGAVTVDGIDVRRSPTYDVAEAVGLVQQNPETQFCTLTVQDEVAFGLENRCLPWEEMKHRIAWALEIVGADHLADRALATLSGGEKQKIAIAAMMAAKPSVLIFDEPTSNLDPTATAEIFDVIARIRSKAQVTVIVIEHKVDYLCSFEPRLVTMEEGRISERQPEVAPSQRISEPPIYPPKGRTNVPINQSPALQVDALCVGYNGVPVLHGVSLAVRAGEFVVVMGDNGSGKTTFLQSLLGLLKPDRGQVEVLGHDTRHTLVSQLAQQVGFVFQNPDHQLFADSVWQEAIFASRNFDLLDKVVCERVETLLDRCGLRERKTDHPYCLSYGEKRRLNLVSVLAHNPQLILLDEVLIGQDAANAAFLMTLLCEQVEQGGTVVMVNHDPEIAHRYASRLIFFNSGHVVVDAPTAEAFQQLASLGRRAYLPVNEL